MVWKIHYLETEVAQKAYGLNVVTQSVLLESKGEHGKYYGVIAELSKVG